MRVNCVLPGFTETTILSDVPEKVLKQLLKMTPLRRMAQPEGNFKIYYFIHKKEAGKYYWFKVECSTVIKLFYPDLLFLSVSSVIITLLRSDHGINK